MRDKLKEMIFEALPAVLPITLTVAGFTVLVSPMPAGMLMIFLAGAALLIFGIGILTTGVDMALIALPAESCAGLAPAEEVS